MLELNLFMCVLELAKSNRISILIESKLNSDARILAFNNEISNGIADALICSVFNLRK